MRNLERSATAERARRGTRRPTPGLAVRPFALAFAPALSYDLPAFLAPGAFDAGPVNRGGPAK